METGIMHFGIWGGVSWFGLCVFFWWLPAFLELFHLRFLGFWVKGSVQIIRFASSEENSSAGCSWSFQSVYGLGNIKVFDKGKRRMYFTR